MSVQQIRATSLGEAFAAIPHMLGYIPENRVTLLPVGASSSPLAAVAAAEAHECLPEIIEVYTRYPGRIYLVGHHGNTTDELRAISRAIEALEDGLHATGTTVEGVYLINATTWTSLRDGASGAITHAETDAMTKTFGQLRAAPPASTRNEARAAILQRSTPLHPAVLAAAVRCAQGRSEEPCGYNEWLLDVAAWPDRLSDTDAAHLALALADPTTAATIRGQMDITTARQRLPLWQDFAARIPDGPHRPAAVAMHAFVRWLSGDALALDVLDELDPHSIETIPTAAITRALAQGNANPRGYQEPTT